MYCTNFGKEHQNRGGDTASQTPDIGSIKVNQPEQVIISAHLGKKPTVGICRLGMRLCRIVPCDTAGISDALLAKP